MARSKKLSIWLGVLFILCVATFFVFKYEDHKEVIKNSGEIILELPSESISKVSWENEFGMFAFHKNENWVYNEDETFPVDAKKMDELLQVFEAFGVTFAIEGVEDYAQYGLDKPICTIKLEAAETSYEVKLGAYSKMDSQRYVSIGDGNVYLVSQDPLDYYDAILSDMIDHDDMPSFEEVTKIQFSGTETYSIVYEEESPNTYCQEDVYFAQKENALLPLDTGRVDTYLQSISNLNPTEYVSYQVTNDELEKFGLNQPELTVTVDYISADEETKHQAQSFVLNISRDPKEKSNDTKAEAIEDNATETDTIQEDEVTAYARVGESQIVYQISSDAYKKLMDASYDDLRHLEIISADFADIDKIEILLDGGAYDITTKGKGENRKYYYAEEELEIDALQTAITALKADRFTDELPAKKEEIEFKLHLYHENDPTIEVKLYQHNGTHCLAVADGKPVALVERSYVIDVIECVNAIVLK